MRYPIGRLLCFARSGGSAAEPTSLAKSFVTGSGDLVLGGAGSDRIYGAERGDVLVGGGGDRLLGGRGDDFAAADRERDVVSGSLGTDRGCFDRRRDLLGSTERRP